MVVFWLQRWCFCGSLVLFAVFVVLFLWCFGCGKLVFSHSFEVRISITERGRTIGHCKDYPDANDELQAGSLVFQPGRGCKRGEGKEDDVAGPS